MLRYIFKRILSEAIPTLLIIATLTFFMVRLAPGGPFSQEKSIRPEVLKYLNAYYGFDQPLYKQYLDYMGKLIGGDLGPSFKYPNRSVQELIWETFPVSFELGCYAFIFALAIGLGSGVLAAMKKNTFWDYSSMSMSMIGICIPNFVLGPILVLIFGLGLGWVNVSGWTYPEDKILPSITLGAVYAAYIARLTRGGLLEVFGQDYIRTARAKGLPEYQVILKHALRGGLIPLLSFLGPAIAGLITGSFVVETLYQIPGLGRFFINAAFNRDYTMVLGTVLFYAMLIMCLNMIVDILLVWLNPELRLEQ